MGVQNSFFLNFGPMKSLFSFSSPQAEKGSWKKLGKTGFVVWWFDVTNKILIIINTFQFFSPPLLLSSSLLLSSVIFVADFCLLLSNNADSKTFGTRNNLGNTKRTAGIIIVIVTHKAYDEINK